MSLTISEKLSGNFNFKSDFHYISIWACNDPKQTWYDIPYLVMDDTIATVLNPWLVECRTTSYLFVRSSKSAGK